MPTVINNPGGETREVYRESNMGTIVGVLVALAILVLFFIYGIPALRDASRGGANTGAGSETNINVDLPDLNSGAGAGAGSGAGAGAEGAGTAQ